MLFSRSSVIAAGLLGTLGALAMGCSSPEKSQRVGDTCAAGASQTTILSRLAFARENPKGVTAGFDIDGLVSDVNQPDESKLLTCKQGDYLDAEGRPGIDNQLAKLLPLLDGITAADVNLIIKGAIENGQLLSTITLDGIDNLTDDPCVEVRFRSGLGTPTMGTDGELDPNQTFELDPTGDETHAVGAIKNGVFEVGPFNLTLLVYVFAEKFKFHLKGARVRLVLDENEHGRVTGVIGGGVTLEELNGIIQEFDLGSAEKDGALGFLRLLGDLDGDGQGTCKSFSIGVTLSGRRAYLAPFTGAPVATTDGGTDAGPAPVDAGPASPDELDWIDKVLPIARETCLQCHAVTAPGRLNLSTYGAWVANRALIKQRVVVLQNMPPATVPLNETRRARLAAWLGN